MAGYGAIGGFGPTNGDHDHVGDTAPTLDAALRSALGPAAAQTTGQLAAKLASALHVEGLVDRLVRHPHLGILGELVAQTASDLQRRPQTPQVSTHTAPQH